MSKYNEPWGIKKFDWGEDVVDCKDVLIGNYSEEQIAITAPRIVACINAMAGIEDPEGFVKEAKRLLVACGDILNPKKDNITLTAAMEDYTDYVDDVFLDILILLKRAK